MQFIFQDEITIVLVEAIREFFATNALAKDWRWSPDDDKSKIEIVDSWPETERRLPMIVVSSLSGGSEEIGFSQGLDKIYDPDDSTEVIGQFYGGRVMIDVTYEAVSFNQRETHRISDLLLIGLASLSQIPRRVSKTTLHNLILDAPFARMAGYGQRPLTEGQMTFFRSLSQRWQSYWKDEVIYDQNILTYLTTAERATLSGGTMDVQFSAGSGPSS